MVAWELPYPIAMQVEELFVGELGEASRIACELMPDVTAALDQVMLRLASGGDRAVVRRYALFVDTAAQTLTSLPARDASALPPAEVVYQLLRQDRVELPWVAPTRDGIGLVTVLVDRMRGFAAGLPQQCVRASHDIDEQRFRWFLKSMAAVELEQESGSPLRRAMTTLGLSSSEMASLMGVKRQAVDKWLHAGPPIERVQKIGAIAEIADILRYRLRDGMPASVVRRSAEAYGDRSMLELIAEDKHEWLLRSVRESFDYSRVA